jgi:hypothetical protein
VNLPERREGLLVVLIDILQRYRYLLPLRSAAAAPEEGRSAVEDRRGGNAVENLVDVVR